MVPYFFRRRPGKKQHLTMAVAYRVALLHIEAKPGRDANLKHGQLKPEYMEEGLRRESGSVHVEGAEQESDESGTRT